MDNKGHQKKTKGNWRKQKESSFNSIFHDMPPNIGDAIYDVQLYEVCRSTLARSQAPRALRRTHTLLKPNAHQNVRTHVRKVPKFTDGA